MKNALGLLLLLPAAALAQQATHTMPDHLVMHCEKMVIEKGLTIYKTDWSLSVDDHKTNGVANNSAMEPNRGNQLPDNSNNNSHSSTTFVTTAVPFHSIAEHDHSPQHAYFTAEKVELRCPDFPLLKADNMVFDNVTNNATLKGHIVINDHGAEKEIGSEAVLCLSHDTYRILSLK